MRAVTCTNAKLEVVEQRTPQPAKGQLLIDVRKCGICGSDLHARYHCDELADMMEIEKAPAGKIVDRMEEKGWVERRPDISDRRINRIHLTDRGERVYAAIQPISQSTIDDALDDLSSVERERLTALLARVKTRLLETAERDFMNAYALDEALGADVDELSPVTASVTP